jgi:hypothetical protein
MYKIQKVVSDRDSGKVIKYETVYTGSNTDCIDLCDKANKVIRMGSALVNFCVKPFKGKKPVKTNFNYW